MKTPTIAIFEGFCVGGEPLLRSLRLSLLHALAEVWVAIAKNPGQLPGSVTNVHACMDIVGDPRTKRF